jgi:hypothetical protein
MTFIILISVQNPSARKRCESLENTKYPSYKELREALLDGELFYSLSDFMDEVNDQRLEDLSDYFITYVHTK